MKDVDKARILLTNGGYTYAAQANVGLKNTPAPLFRLFLFSLLSSARISADIAVAASKELRRTGITTARAAREAKRSDIIDALAVPTMSVTTRGPPHRSTTTRSE